MSSPHLEASDTFLHRHIGPDDSEIRAMLQTLGHESLDALSDAAIPARVRLKEPLRLEGARSQDGEFKTVERLSALALQNQVLRSCIGQGYYDCITPAVIARNILENPAWYTAYTPYQSEIAQGRLEALLIFQTMVSDLTGLEIANASLLDEGTAAAEAMSMARGISANPKQTDFFIADDCHPQTIAVVRTRADSLGIHCIVGRPNEVDFSTGRLFGLLVQYPATEGAIRDYRGLFANAKSASAVGIVATDLLALTLLTPPGEFGAEIAIGSSQRFGVPMGYGGPHAAFLATTAAHVRRVPGRIVGVSKDVHGNPAYRLAIQTREQHIRREKATSNICTAQVLLAVMAGMYAVWHGPEGLRRISERVAALTAALSAGVRRMGHATGAEPVFDTVRISLNGLPADSVMEAARLRGYNLRAYDAQTVGVSLDETSTRADVEAILESFAGGATFRLSVDQLVEQSAPLPEQFKRTSLFLKHPVFHQHHSETQMLRYLHKLAGKDLTLAQSMIPLGSCTMKLNGTSEMLPVSWPGFARMHPFAPAEQARGYKAMTDQLEQWLGEIAGLPHVSLQPNAGSQGEYAGLLAIRAYHRATGQERRNVCLIPTSAHGTNPASAVVAGFNVVSVACTAGGAVDLADLAAKTEAHRDDLACLMITYPSTYGLFDEQVRQICQTVHSHGGQVYMDGANMNAQVGLCRPGDMGADVCHLNLHKTFCIPHGGGGPGMGPIAVAPHLAAFLPRSCSSAPYGSALILTISWMYIAMMGADGLKRASQVAILNANYMARRLAGHYPLLFTGGGGLVAHEFILDCRGLEASAGVKAEDIAKRLMDYGFHAPTMSWPVPGTLMIEPTESESKAEMDRFCDALISIRAEIRAIEESKTDRTDNVLKGAPHTAAEIAGDSWPHGYSRKQAAYPAAWLSDYKFWPPVGRIDNPFGDRNLFCACPPAES